MTYLPALETLRFVESADVHKAGKKVGRAGGASSKNRTRPVADDQWSSSVIGASSTLILVAEQLSDHSSERPVAARSRWYCSTSASNGQSPDAEQDENGTAAQRHGRTSAHRLDRSLVLLRPGLQADLDALHTSRVVRQDVTMTKAPPASWRGLRNESLSHGFSSGPSGRLVETCPTGDTDGASTPVDPRSTARTAAPETPTAAVPCVSG